VSAAIITAALTGPIATKDDNPALPTSPEEIAEAACGAWEAGEPVDSGRAREMPALG
jgi:3-keto-5-aminohexanoate cleavage enzyme